MQSCKIINIKSTLKYILTRINCKINHIPYKNGMCLGYGFKAVGKGKISLMGGVMIRPLDMIITLSKDAYVEIHSGCDLGQFSRIGCIGKIVLEENVLTGPNVFIADYNHNYKDVDKPIIKSGNSFVPTTDGSPNVVIGAGSWLGTNVVIAGNVKIGKHCVIGANSVVTSDIPDYSIAVGAPCKVIKRYNFETKEWIRTK